MFDIKLFSELEQIELNLKSLDKSLRSQIEKMRDLEHEPRLEGFTLKPISLSEAKALNKSFGLI